MSWNGSNGYQSGDFPGSVPDGDASIRHALLWAGLTCPPNQAGQKATSPEVELLRDYSLKGSTIEENEEIKQLDLGKENRQLMRCTSLNGAVSQAEIGAVPT